MKNNYQEKWKYESIEELEKYLEDVFIPSYLRMQKIVAEEKNGEYYQVIYMQHIKNLGLSKREVDYVIKYLDKCGIRVIDRDEFVDKKLCTYKAVYKIKNSVVEEESLRKLALYRETGNKEIRDELVESYMELVLPIALWYKKIYPEVRQEDMESYGYEGIMHAIKKYDNSVKMEFKNFVVSSIRYYILKCVRDFYHDTGSFYFSYLKFLKEVENKYHTTIEERLELVDEIVDMFIKRQVFTENYREGLKLRIFNDIINKYSLDDEDTIRELYNTNQLVDNSSLEENVYRDVLCKEIQTILNDLEQREREIIIFRFGLDDGIEHGYREIGQKYGISYQRVGQIMKKAILKIRDSQLSDTQEYIDEHSSKKRIRNDF